MAVIRADALTSVSDVKESLGIASGITTSDNLITRKINAATQIILNYTDTTFTAKTNTNEEYDASSQPYLVVRNSPIIALTSLDARQTTANQASWTTIDTSLYFVDKPAGVIKFLSHFWGRFNSWRVTYTSGWATIPDDVAEACAILAAYMVQNPTTAIGVKMKREGSREIQYQNAIRYKTLFEELGIDYILDQYADPIIAGDR